MPVALCQEETFEITCNEINFSLLARIFRFGRHSIGKGRLQRLPYADAISKARGQSEGDNCLYICRHPGMVL